MVLPHPDSIDRAQMHIKVGVATSTLKPPRTNKRPSSSTAQVPGERRAQNDTDEITDQVQ